MPSRKERHALNALIDDMCAPFNRETNAILNEVAISKQNNGRGLHIVLGRKIGKMVGGLVREGRHLTKFTEDDEDAISHEAADIAALKEEETGRHFQTSGNTDFVDAETELALGRSTVLDEVRRWVKRSPSPPHGYGHHAVKVGDDVVLVHDYLGPSHDKVIKAFNDISRYRTPEGLNRTLFDYQEKSAAKMVNGVTGPHRTCFLIDEMGLGKTTTTSAAIIPLNRLSRSRYFEPEDLGRDHITVIVTTKSVGPQWVQEMVQCFKKGWQPRILVLSSAIQITLDEIRSKQYDVIIVSYSYVLSESRRKEGYERFVKAVKRDGLHIAKLLAKSNNWPTKMPRLPLSAETWDFFNMRIATLIADEVHLVKLFEGKQRLALKALRYNTFVGLSGTPFKNRWADLFGILNLMPKSIWDKDTCWRVFGGSDTPHMLLPSITNEDRLIKLLLAFTTGHSYQIRKPEKQLISTGATFAVDMMTARRATTYFFLFADALRRRTHKSRQDAMRWSTFAQLATAHDWLIQRHSAELSPEEIEAVNAQNQRFERDLEQAWTNFDSHHIPLPKWADMPRELIRDYKSFERQEAMLLWREDPHASDPHLHIRRSKKKQSKSMPQPRGRRVARDAPEEAGTVVDPAASMPAAPSATTNAHEVQPAATPLPSTVQAEDPHAESDESGNDHSSDEDYVPSEVEDATADIGVPAQDVEAGDDNAPELSTMYTPESRDKFRERLRNASTEELFSPRVLKVVQQVEEVIQGHYGSGLVKTLVWSRFLSFLDIVEEALRRRSITCSRFHGELDLDEREEILKEFKNSTGTRVLLITPGSGGVGLNIVEASVNIICEPWWNHNEVRQAESRAYRFGQTRDVHTIQISASNSPMDRRMLKTAEEKRILLDRLMGRLHSFVDKDPEIPEIEPAFTSLPAKIGR